MSEEDKDRSVRGFARKITLSMVEIAIDGLRIREAIKIRSDDDLDEMDWTTRDHKIG